MRGTGRTLELGDVRLWPAKAIGAELAERTYAIAEEGVMGILHKVKGLVGKHETQVKNGIDKVAQTADEKTGGKHTDKIASAAEKAKAQVDKLND